MFVWKSDKEMMSFQQYEETWFLHFDQFSRPSQRQAFSCGGDFTHCNIMVTRSQPSTSFTQDEEAYKFEKV